MGHCRLRLPFAYTQSLSLRKERSRTRTFLNSSTSIDFSAKRSTVVANSASHVLSNPGAGEYCDDETWLGWSGCRLRNFEPTLPILHRHVSDDCIRIWRAFATDVITTSASQRTEYILRIQPKAWDEGGRDANL